MGIAVTSVVKTERFAPCLEVLLTGTIRTSSNSVCSCSTDEKSIRRVCGERLGSHTAAAFSEAGWVTYRAGRRSETADDFQRETKVTRLSRVGLSVKAIPSLEFGCILD
jgi:hypothetical protein